MFMIVTTPTSGGPVYQRNSAQGVRSKEEKETVEAFALAFTSLNPQVFYNILGSHMEVRSRRARDACYRTCLVLR